MRSNVLVLYMRSDVLLCGSMRVSSVYDLGALVRSRRRLRGLTQAELAGQMGVQVLWVSQFEGGKSTAQVGLVLRALRVLDIDLWAGESNGDESDVGLDAIINPSSDSCKLADFRSKC